MEMTAALHRTAAGVRRHGAGALTRRVALRGIRPALTPIAARRLRRSAEAAGSLDELLDVAFGFDSLEVRIPPGQVRGEIAALLRILEPRACRRVLEIGTQHGGSLFLFAHVSAPDAQIVSVDLPHGEFGGGYPVWRAPLYRRFGRAGQRIELVRGDSHAAETLARVRSLLAGEPLDFLFVDGDHTYEGVKQDFESYRELVRPGGLIALHDIAPGVASAEAEQENLLGGDVPRFWSELTQQYPTTELCASQTGFFGIGVVHL
jgi:predicted O-methyltransferase YrrM